MTTGPVRWVSSSRIQSRSVSWVTPMSSATDLVVALGRDPG
ncbi:hypothetical protein [Saccharothrix saharensis]|nr:hypothetical protein [Saccharothrix saharensis]